MGVGGILLSTDEQIKCQSCGALVAKGRFCPKCGAILGATELDEVKDQLERLNEIKDLTNQLRGKVLDKLSINSEKLLLAFREEFSIIHSRFETKHKQLSKKPSKKTAKTETTEGDRINCTSCGASVPNVRFCKECGSPLHATPLDELNDLANRLNNLALIFSNFKDSIQKELVDDELELANNIVVLLNQFINRINAKRNALAKTLDVPIPARRPKEVKVTPAVAPVGKPRVEAMLVEPGIKQPTVWSNIEKNLLNYWFFYLAIILLSIGITVVIYYVVVTLDSKVYQLVVIYIIGFVILLIGQLITSGLRWRTKKKLAEKEKEVDYKPGDTIERVKDSRVTEERRMPVPQITSVIIFIGFIVLFVGGFIGLAAYQSLGVPKYVFLLISYGICLASIGLGILNNSEMLMLTGFIPAIIFTAIDILWEVGGSGTSSLGSVGSLFGFTLPIVFAALVAIFFRKWWGSVVTMSVTPFLIMIPKISAQIGLEFIPLMLIPIMVVLVVRFSKDKIPLPIRRSLTVMSLLFPSIALFVLAYPYAIFQTEPAWSRIYPFEIFISCLTILGVSFYYRFIQEEYLEIRSNQYYIWIVGQIFVGAISVFTIAVNDTIVTTALFFASYFIFGILSVLKIMKKHFNVASAIVSFIFAELQAILLLTLNNPTRIAQDVLYYILGISFLLLTIVSIFISNVFIESTALYAIWSIISGINIILLGLLGTLNAWYAFSGIILLLVTSLIVNLPIIIPHIKEWRMYSIVSLIVNAIVISIFLLTGSLEEFPYEALIIFVIFIVINVSAFFDWKIKEVKVLE